MVNINPLYFSLYAARKRGAMAKTGYPSQVPFYSPPRLGDTADGPCELYTDDDWSVVESIESCLSDIGRTRKALVVSFDIWEGAFPGALSSRPERCEQAGVDYGRCRKSAYRCKKEIERLMHG
jgi:hypothetical protein